MASVHSGLVAACIAASGIVAAQRPGPPSLIQPSAAAPAVEEGRFGDEPWAFVRRGSETTALPAVQYRGRLIGDVRIRLADGRLGSLRIEPRGCGPPDTCAPLDCGCFASDSHWIYVIDADGRIAVRIHLWAAYGAFDIVPLDLVDGPADELLVVRILGRSSPPNGHDVKIFQLLGATAAELLESHQIAGNLSGRPMVCGFWRSRLLVDLQEAKPRSIEIDNRVRVPANCRLDDPASAELIRRRQPVLSFSQGRYAIR